MKVVIEIPEEDYNFVTKQVADGITNPLKICIANGTPLPKGHGRLIDADKLMKTKRMWYRLKNGDVACPEIDIEHAPTIIEADKAERSDNT